MTATVQIYLNKVNPNFKEECWGNFCPKEGDTDCSKARDKGTVQNLPQLLPESLEAVSRKRLSNWLRRSHEEEQIQGGCDGMFTLHQPQKGK